MSSPEVMFAVNGRVTLKVLWCLHLVPTPQEISPETYREVDRIVWTFFRVTLLLTLLSNVGPETGVFQSTNVAPRNQSQQNRLFTPATLLICFIEYIP